MKNSGATLALIILLNTFVSDVVASCRRIANEEMLEYFCESGQPSDLITIPETTEKLRITRMHLGRITADTFSRFGGNLWVLSCLYCEIIDIDPDAFRQLINLQQLSLNNNYLTTVKASWFEGLDFLTYLDLNYNNIHDIEDDVYRNLPSLIDLRVSGNQLRCLNLNEMSYLKELKRIFLSENSNFACPHAVSEFLEKQNVAFEPDPEWRKLASDTIDVPPSYMEEDHRTLHSDERPEQPEMPYIPPTRDRMFHQDHYAEHRYRQRRPTTTVRPTTSRQNEIPRVEPRFPPTRTSPPDSSSHQVMMPYPLSTPETLPAPPVIWRPSESIRMIGITNQGPQTEHISMYPQHVLTYETTPYPKDSILERLRAAESSAGSSVKDNHETTVKSDRLSQTGTTLTYPLYFATSNDWDRMTPGSIEVSHHSDSDTITIDSWSTDHSNRHPDWSNKQSSPPIGSSDDRWLPNTSNYSHKMIDESSNTGNIPVDNVPVDQVDRSETATMMSNIHYVRPSIVSSPELIYSPSSPGESGESHQGTPYEGTAHPPLYNYELSTNDDVTTTDKPLPECPTRNSANFSRIRSYIIVLTMSLIITIFGHVIAEGF